MRHARLWLGPDAAIVGSFAVRGDFEAKLYRPAPPTPERVVISDGRVLRTEGVTGCSASA
jgi:nitric oxide reductase large subunit